MINNLSDRFISYLIKKGILKQEDYSDYDYYMRIFLFNFIIISVLGSINYYFNSLLQLIIISVVFNILRSFSGGWHSTNGNLEQCIAFTIPYITIMSLFAKYTINYSHFVFIISMGLGIFIIKMIPQIPLKQLNKDVSYFRNQYINWFLFFYVLNSICIFINNHICNIISTSISFGVIGVAIIIKQNKNNM